MNNQENAHFDELERESNVAGYIAARAFVRFLIIGAIVVIGMVLLDHFLANGL